MSIEQKINYQLNKYPAIKKVIKRVYQRSMYAISPKIKSEGNISRISPDDSNHEYFFGYYDKSPWDITDRYMLCMRANDTWSDVSPREKADILIIDTEKKENDPDRVRKIAETNAWNVQQSCMLQWLGPDYSSRVLYNDYRNGKYCSVILTLETMEERVIEAPVYSVSADGKFALTLDFSRLYELRPGYGYYNVPEKTKDIALPDTTAIWKVDLVTGKVTDVLKYTDFANFKARPEMKEEGSVHKVNHIMLSPNGKRFMVLYRWFNGQRKYTRLVTCNVDGTDMYVLSDDDMVSHCYWKDDETILAFENKKKTGPGYYLMKDRSAEYIHCWPQFSNDGHPSYSPNGKYIVTDSYPDRARIATINLMDGDERQECSTPIARVFAPFKYDNDTRCDLHPRWSRDGNKICFDSVFEGHRGLYVVELQKTSILTSSSSKKISVIVPVYNVEKYLERCVKSILEQSYQNLEIILVDDGSTDNSGKICDTFAQKFNNIKVIHKINGGLSSARNAGMAIATGDYLAFVDSDDWIEKDIYAACINAMEQYNCDVVDFLPVYTDGRNIPRINNVYSKPSIVEDDDIIYDYLYRGQTDISPFTVWRKLYKKNLFENINFPEGRINEDIVTNFKVLCAAKKLVHISNVGYFYFQNTESLSSGKLKKRDFDLLYASKELCRLSSKLGRKDIYKLARIKLGRSYFSLLAKAAVGGFGDDISDAKVCIKELTKQLRKNYRLLMQAPISKNRKIMITLVAINYNLLAMPVKLYKLIKNR